MTAQMTMFDEPAAVVLPPIRLKPRRELAEAARDRGIERAVEHADAVETGWSDVAYAHLQVFLLKLPTGAKVTGEQIREHAEKEGLRIPPDKRAWGAVMMKACRAGLIRKVGWTTATDPKTHCNPISSWVRA
jgi:hypothetical protein